MLPVLPLCVPKPPLRPRASFIELAEIAEELDMDEGATTDADVDEERASECSSVPAVEAETPDHSDTEAAPSTPHHVDDQDQDLALDVEMIDTLLQDLMGPLPPATPPATPVVQTEAAPPAHFPVCIFD